MNKPPDPMLDEDIEARLAEIFTEEHLADMRTALACYTGKEVARVQMAVIHLSQGDPDRLYSMVDAALVDYRDVLFWAEYPDEVEALKKQLETDKNLKDLI